VGVGSQFGLGFGLVCPPAAWLSAARPSWPCPPYEISSGPFQVGRSLGISARTGLIRETPLELSRVDPTDQECDTCPDALGCRASRASTDRCVGLDTPGCSAALVAGASANSLRYTVVRVSLSQVLRHGSDRAGGLTASAGEVSSHFRLPCSRSALPGGAAARCCWQEGTAWGRSQLETGGLAWRLIWDRLLSGRAQVQREFSS